MAPGPPQRPRDRGQLPSLAAHPRRPNRPESSVAASDTRAVSGWGMATPSQPREVSRQGGTSCDREKVHSLPNAITLPTPTPGPGGQALLMVTLPGSVWTRQEPSSPWGWPVPGWSGQEGQGDSAQLQPQAVNRLSGCRYKSWSPGRLSVPPADCLPRALEGSQEVSPAREGGVGAQLGWSSQSGMVGVWGPVFQGVRGGPGCRRPLGGLGEAEKEQRRGAPPAAGLHMGPWA